MVVTAPYYGRVVPRAKTIALVVGGGQEIVGIDQNRLGLIIGCQAGNTILVSIRKLVIATTGIPVGLNAENPFKLTWSDWGPLVGSAWYGAATIGTNVEVIELIRESDPDRPVGTLDISYGDSGDR